MLGNTSFGFSGSGGSTPPPVSSNWLLNGNTNGAEKYFGTNDNFSIPLYTNGIARGIILNTGDFGFGTISPTSRVHIVGLDSTSSNYALKINNSASSPLLYVRNDGYSAFGSLVSSINPHIEIGGAWTLNYVHFTGTGTSNGFFINTDGTDYQDGFVKIVGNSSSNLGSFFEPSGSSAVFRIAKNDGVGILDLHQYTANGKIFISSGTNYSGTTPTNIGLVLSNGNNAFGTITPLAKLHIFGINSSGVNQRLEPIANLTEDTTGGVVTTSDGTANVTAQTISVTLNTVVSLESTIVYRKTSGVGVGSVGDGTTIKLNSSVKNISGTLTLDTIQNTYTGTTNSISGVSATYTISGTNVLVSVTGVVNDNITWNVITKVNTVA